MDGTLSTRYNLLNLPVEIIINILMNLNGDSLIHLARTNKFFNQIILSMKNNFIKKFIHINKYEKLWWSFINNNITNHIFMLGLRIQSFVESNQFEETCNILRINILPYQNIEAVKMLYIICVKCNKVPANIAASDINELSSVNIKCAYYYYKISAKYKDIFNKYIERIVDDIIWLYEDVDVNLFFRKIDEAVEIGGSSPDVYYLLCTTDNTQYNIYYNYLLFNIPSSNALEYATHDYEVFTTEQLMTYKGLIPIIGEKYSIYILETYTNIESEENIVYILSQLHASNIENIITAEYVISNFSEEVLNEAKSVYIAPTRN